MKKGKNVETKTWRDGRVNGKRKAPEKQRRERKTCKGRRKAVERKGGK